MKTKKILAAILCLNAFSAVAETTDEMELAASVWGAWMRGSVNVDGQQAKVERSAINYIDMDYGYSLELALRNSKLVLLGYLDYFDPISSDVSVGLKEGTLDSSELNGGIAIGFPMGSGNSTLDFLIGLQMLRMDNDLDLKGGSSYSESANVYDAVLMMRYKQELFSNLYLNIPLLIGGTYLSDSEFVYDAGVQLLYQLGTTLDIRAGYRISGYDFDEDEDATDFYQQGYTLGIGLTF
ncbi:hypothetical protein [Pontiella sp.]|uniref:hypothetical protein n=1 Tax=Pontiella sp. TaxID=2837462 RepID=UPI0035648239